ncbi:MAG TPA: hypothetical protein VHL34_06525 [Rhizomicrobium sp.]|jgi:hypothetical protein|nr:hypothetical protein [Rhizomicrobium sp.]
MRTTITLDPDNVARLEKLQKERDLTFKEAVNEVIRQGLNEADRPFRPQPFKTRVLDAGEPKFRTPEELKELIYQIQEEEDLRKVGMLRDPD